MMRRTTAVASSANAPAPIAIVRGTAPIIEEDVRPWERAGAAVRSARGAAPQNANPNRLRKPSGRMRYPEESLPAKPAAAGTTNRRRTLASQTCIHVAAWRGGEPESGNHTGVRIHRKESLSVCIAGKSIPLGIDRGPNSERMVNACFGVNEG